MYLGIARAESVPSANAIKFWIRRLKKTASALRGRGQKAPWTVRNPENVQLLREAFKVSPRRSAR